MCKSIYSVQDNTVLLINTGCALGLHLHDLLPLNEHRIEKVNSLVVLWIVYKRLS